MVTINKGPEANSGIGSTTAAAATAELNKKNAGAPLGFGTNDVFVMKTAQGSDYVNKIAEELKLTYAKKPEAKDIKINVLDKEVITNLAYSAIAVSNNINGVIYYHIILLSATGKDAMTALDMFNSAQQAMYNQNNNQNNITPIFTIDDALDGELHNEVLKVLHSVWNAKKYISADGTVIPKEHSDMMPVRIAAIDYNAVTIDGVVNGITLSDLNIREALKAKSRSELVLETNLLRQTVLDEVENPVRHDFSVDLIEVDNSTRVTSLNLQNNKIVLAKITGHIDAIPAIVPVNPGMAQQQLLAPRLHPHIIMSYNDVKTPTTGFLLLGILAGTVMSNENMWLQALMPHNKKDKHNVGALNILTNLKNLPEKIGAPIDLTSKSLKNEEAYGLLKQMFTESPIISYDVQSFGPQAYFTSLLAIAAEPNGSDAKYAAAREIVETADWLTDGEFGSDFNLDSIFINSGVVVPTGTWADNTGVRDIKDVDLAFIANVSGDVELLNKWTDSNMPKSLTGNDPFLTKIEVISKIIPDAEITGKAIRVTFTSEFINRLVAAAMRAGLNARHDAKVIFADNNNLGMVNNYLIGAGLNNAAQFTRQGNEMGNSFNMRYSNMGHNRY